MAPAVHPWPGDAPKRRPKTLGSMRFDHLRSGDLGLECDGAPSFNLMAALRLRHATPAERAVGAGFAIIEGEQASATNEAHAWRDVRAIAAARLAVLEAVSGPQGGQGGQGGQGAENIARPPSAQLAETWRDSQTRVLRATLARAAAGAAQLKETQPEAQGTKRPRA